MPRFLGKGECDKTTHDCKFVMWGDFKLFLRASRIPFPDRDLRRPGRAIGALIAAMALSTATIATANGVSENVSWQFETTADKANKAMVLDMSERRRGGYYDGFGTTVNNHNTTNVGTQVNCNVGANAIGNQAQNSQVANSPTVSNTSSTDSSSTGNAAQNGSGDGTGATDTAQDNSGDVSAGVSGSDTTSSSGAISTGSSDQALNNHQDNSGNQYASVDNSLACDMTGSTVSGAVDAPYGGGPLN